jgi:hypothetical protein
MSEELSHKQVRFLNDYWEAKRKIRDVLSDLEITPDELADWRRKDKLFRRKLRNVELSLGMVREMEIRTAAVEAIRKIACCIWSLAGFRSMWQLRACKVAIDLARRIDPMLRRGWRRPLRPEDVVDPVHPAYRAQAARLMDEMEELRERGRKAKREGMGGERPWEEGSHPVRGEPRVPPNRPPIEDKVDPARWNDK